MICQESKHECRVFGADLRTLRRSESQIVVKRRVYIILQVYTTCANNIVCGPTSFLDVAGNRIRHWLTPAQS